MQIAIWIIGIAAVLLLLLAFGGGYLLYRTSIRRDDRRVNNPWDGELWRSDTLDDGEFALMKEGEAFLKGRMLIVFSLMG